MAIAFGSRPAIVVHIARLGAPFVFGSFEGGEAGESQQWLVCRCKAKLDREIDTACFKKCQAKEPMSTKETRQSEETRKGWKNKPTQ